MSGLTDYGYAPFDSPKPVAPGIWVVDAPPIRAMGITMPVRMTVVRLPSGALWLHSPIRWSQPLSDALASLGPVGHLVAPSLGHWTFLADWQERTPGAVTWAVPNLRRRPQVRLSRVRLDRDLDEDAPPDWTGTLRQVVVRGAGGYAEAVFLHEPSRTAILTDLIANLDRDLPLASRAYARLTGTSAPRGGTPRYLRLPLRLGGSRAKEAVARILGWEPERVIFSHGRWFDRDGARRLADALAWLPTPAGG